MLYGEELKQCLKISCAVPNTGLNTLNPFHFYIITMSIDVYFSDGRMEIPALLPETCSRSAALNTEIHLRAVLTFQGSGAIGWGESLCGMTLP